jgi:hypothetical protein
MEPEESVLLTTIKLHNALSGTNQPNWETYSRELRRGVYKFPSDEAARQYEDYLNSYKGRGFERRTNWCVETRTKMC